MFLQIKFTDGNEVGVIEIVLRLDPDEDVEEELLNVVQGGGGGQADERVGWEKKSFFFVRLSNEDAQPDVHGQVEKPGGNVEVTGSLGKADQGRSQCRHWQD